VGECLRIRWEFYPVDTSSSTETPGTETETFRFEAGEELQTHSLHGAENFVKS
jgi:hypothetical protein